MECHGNMSHCNRYGRDLDRPAWNPVYETDFMNASRPVVRGPSARPRPARPRPDRTGLSHRPVRQRIGPISTRIGGIPTRTHKIPAKVCRPSRLVRQRNKPIPTKIGGIPPSAPKIPAKVCRRIRNAPRHANIRPHPSSKLTRVPHSPTMDASAPHRHGHAAHEKGTTMAMTLTTPNGFYFHITKIGSISDITLIITQYRHTTTRSVSS